MATIRVKCPACKTELEIDAEHVGEDVECGNCLEVFKAQPPASLSKPAPRADEDEDEDKPAKPKPKSRRRDDDDDDDDRPRRKRRRRRDDDDDDDYYDAPPPRRAGGSNGLAVTSLILGILAIFPGCCCYLWVPLSLGSIVTGSIGMKNENGKGMAIAGVVLGVIALLLYGSLAVIGFGLNMNDPNRFR